LFIIKYREGEAMKLCLKHLRQRNLLDSFESLQKRCKIRLEDPFLSDLYHMIVHHANFQGVEQLIQEACDRNMFEDHISDTLYKPHWKRIYFNDEMPKPCMRGGHQMCIDHLVKKEMMDYLD
jgi:hypothetical protein